MEFGIALTPGTDSWRTAAQAERLGFTHAWFYDSQLLYADVFVALALAAANTTRIRLGTGVLIPTNRIAPVAAGAFASLEKLAPGRIDFGVGTGFTGRNTMGLRPQPLGAMMAYIDVVQALMRGETTEWAVEGQRKQIRFLNPGLGLISAGRALPLHISAFGPRGIALTAREADGWLTFFGPIGRAVAQAAQVDAACGAAGRDPRSLYRTAFTLGCVLGPGEAADSPRALAQAGPVVAVSFHGMMESGLVPPGMEDALARYRTIYEGYTPATARYLDLHEGHLLYVRPEERPFITAELIRASSFTGTPAELRDGLRALAAAGYDQVAVQLVHGHEHALEEWARVFDTV